MAKEARKGSIYALVGEIGAGKTAFVRGFAKGFGVDTVSSPTFTIVNEYAGSLPLYHFDVYRINSIRELENTGFEEYFYGDGVTLVEWADMIFEALPANAVLISFERDASLGEDFRRIVVTYDNACA